MAVAVDIVLRVVELVGYYNHLSFQHMDDIPLWLVQVVAVVMQHQVLDKRERMAAIHVFTMRAILYL